MTYINSTASKSCYRKRNTKRDMADLSYVAKRECDASKFQAMKQDLDALESIEPHPVKVGNSVLYNMKIEVGDDGIHELFSKSLSDFDRKYLQRELGKKKYRKQARIQTNVQGMRTDAPARTLKCCDVCDGELDVELSSICNCGERAYCNQTCRSADSQHLKDCIV